MTNEQRSRAFCVYEHWRPDRDACFYVGKGRPRRAERRFDRTHNKRHIEIMEELAKGGWRPVIKIVACELSEEAAFALEKERIGYWRAQGIDLANITGGGQGASGRPVSAETRAKISMTLKGKPRNLSPEARAKISGANTGKKLTPEHRAIISPAQKGKPKSAQHIAKLRAARKKRPPPTDEQRAHMSMAARRKAPASAESRAKMSKSAIAAWARRLNIPLQSAQVTT